MLASLRARCPAASLSAHAESMAPRGGTTFERRTSTRLGDAGSALAAIVFALRILGGIPYFASSANIGFCV
ncbi:hypothetical protein HMPREF0972_02184 [Actinomyces sp. oral taxon 848 str. F0332]|nr:hypothetical protein HMPREF0972_02184 [Actinomyces sp. oral taxon 848 str. F0332]